MFEVFCPAHRCRVLLATSRILALESGHDGIVVEWRCWCGHHGRSTGGRSFDGGAVDIEPDGTCPDGTWPDGTWPAAS
jgi:hypothetical protein